MDQKPSNATAVREHTELLWAVIQGAEPQGGTITFSQAGADTAAASPRAGYSAVHAWAASQLGLSIPSTPSQKCSQANPQLPEVNPKSGHPDCEH